jgi:hypothetical protein
MAGILKFKGSESRAYNSDKENRDKSSKLKSNSILKDNRFLIKTLS